MRFIALLGGLGMAAAVFSACGGGDETEVPPTGGFGFMPWIASPTAVATTAAPTAVASTAAPTAAAAVEDRAQVEALLKAAALRRDDLPEGFTLEEEEFITNEEAAEEDRPYGGPTVEDLNRFGRILGYAATYSPETPPALAPATLSFVTGTTAHQDSDGAHEHFEFVRQQVSAPQFVQATQDAFTESSDAEIRDIGIFPLSLPEVAEDRMAFEVWLKAHYPDPDRDLDFFMPIVAILRDGTISSVMLSAVGSPWPVQDLEALARTLDRRLKEALESAAP